MNERVLAALKQLHMECLDEGHSDSGDPGDGCRWRGMAIRCGICMSLDDAKAALEGEAVENAATGSQREGGTSPSMPLPVAASHDAAADAGAGVSAPRETDLLAVAKDLASDPYGFCMRGGEANCACLYCRLVRRIHDALDSVAAPPAGDAPRQFTIDEKAARNIVLPALRAQRYGGDHACVQCYPHGEEPMLIKGFVCTLHRLEAWLTSGDAPPAQEPQP